jgi:hypothetical protein
MPASFRTGLSGSLSITYVMPLNTVSAATRITPGRFLSCSEAFIHRSSVVISTFFEHFHKKLEKTKAEKDKDPSSDILFDQ